MPRTTIVIASVLKPVYEPRMYEKIAITLSKNREASVHVIGYGNVVDKTGLSPFIYGIGRFKRLSLKRLFASYLVLRHLFKIKPNLAIACTHELLIPFLIYKCFHPSVRLIYDLQENYYLNILHTTAFPSIIRWPIALWVRCKERITLPLFSNVLAAEKCYLNEMPFIQTKATIIANKANLNIQVLKGRENKLSNSKIILLFSGTISEEYGIYDAIDLVEKLNAKDPSIVLRIVGFCADLGQQQKLKDYISQKQFVIASPFTEPVSHQEIMDAMTDSDWGLLAYKHNHATSNRIPTKLYEYIAHRLPILCTNNPSWKAIVTKYEAGVCIDYKKADLDALIHLLKNPPAFESKEDSDELLWDSEAVKLNRIIFPLA